MNKKQKIIATSLVSILIVSATGYFFSHYQLKFHAPIKVTLTSPIQIIKRVLAMNVTVQADPHNSPLNPDQQYACDLFGKDCATALAIMRAESHYRHDAININKNGTADLGCWQINTVHLAQIDTTNENLLNCHDNTQVAYRIYKQQKGFSAWVTYNTGDYKKYLIN